MLPPLADGAPAAPPMEKRVAEQGAAALTALQVAHHRKVCCVPACRVPVGAWV